MREKEMKIEELLAQIFDELQELDNPEEHQRNKEEFVFHMLDWKNDLEKISQIYTSPEHYEVEASEIIAGFLYHVIPHLNRAGNLLLDSVPNPFDKETQNADIVIR